MLLLDVAAGIRHLREQGCEKIVLLGNSGGSSLAAFYQAQARCAKGQRLTQTPSGDPFDLNNFDLPAADAVACVAGHIGQGLLLGKLLDPSVADESDPITAVPELDLFNPQNGFQIPPESSRFSPEFLARYHEAQLARVSRLDAQARQMIQDQRNSAKMVDQANGDAAAHLQRASRAGWHMIIYRTTADPASVDLNIDPDDRIVSTYSAQRPDWKITARTGLPAQ